MAQVTIKLCYTDETIPIDDISLENITGEYLISELILNELTPNYSMTEIGGCSEYHLIIDNKPLMDLSLSLEELGVKDGDVIGVVGKPNGAINYSFII